MAILERITLETQRCTLGDLRQFVERLEGQRDELTVSVTVEPTTPHPTDPGGTIRLSALADWTPPAEDGQL